MIIKDDILSPVTAAGIDSVEVAPRRHPERLFPPQPESCEITVACFRADYSASAIARAVEDCDAHLLNLNVTGDILPSGAMTVELRVSHRDSGAVSRSLERYGYRVTATSGGYDAQREVMQSRIDQLLARLD